MITNINYNNVELNLSKNKEVSNNFSINKIISIYKSKYCKKGSINILIPNKAIKEYSKIIQKIYILIKKERKFLQNIQTEVENKLETLFQFLLTNIYNNGNLKELIENIKIFTLGELNVIISEIIKHYEEIIKHLRLLLTFFIINDEYYDELSLPKIKIIPILSSRNKEVYEIVIICLNNKIGKFKIIVDKIGDIKVITNNEDIEVLKYDPIKNLNEMRYVELSDKKKLGEVTTPDGYKLIYEVIPIFDKNNGKIVNYKIKLIKFIDSCNAKVIANLSISNLLSILKDALKIKLENCERKLSKFSKLIEIIDNNNIEEGKLDEISKVITFKEMKNEKEEIIRKAIHYYINNICHFKEIVDYCVRNNVNVFTVRELKENVEGFKNLIGKTTIYRFIQQLVKNNIIKVIGISKKEKLYTFNFDINKFIEMLHKILRKEEITLKP